MANRFTKYDSQPYVSTYVPLPIDMMAKVLSEKQGQYDKAEQERLEILGKQTNRLQADANKLQSAKSEVDKKLEEFANKDLTDPGVKAEWYKTKRDIVNRYGPQGDIGSMQSNYDAHKEYMKGLKSKLEKGPKEGGIDLDTYNKLASISLDQYKGIGSDTGEGYNQYKGIDAAGYVDIVDQADKLGKDWKANAISKGGYYDVSGRFIKKSTQEIEQTDPNEIYQHIKPQLMADPMNQAYAKQHVMLGTYGRDRFIGQDEAGNAVEYNPDYYKEKMYDDIFDKPAKFAAAKYGYSKEKQDQTWKESQGYLRNLDKSDDEVKRLKAFQLSEQFVGADPLVKNNDKTYTRTAQSVLGDNYKYEDGKLKYSPTISGENYINVFGKNVLAKDAISSREIDIDGVKLEVVNFDKDKVTVKIAGENGWKYVNYPIKKAEKNAGINQDFEKLNSSVKRLGANAGNMDEATAIFDDYMHKVNDLEASSNAFPPEFGNWMSSQFGVKMSQDGSKIIDPGQLSNVTIKTPDGENITDESLKSGILTGANLNGFSQSMANKKIGAGDIEITSNDGKRYIINTGLSNIKNASQQSDRLLKSVNNFVTKGDLSIKPDQAKADEAGIARQLGVAPGLVKVFSEERDYEGNKYVSYLHNGPNGVEMKSFVFQEVLDPKTNKNKDVLVDIVDIGEASRRLSSSGLAKHLNYFNPKGVSGDSKNYQKYQTVSDDNIEP